MAFPNLEHETTTNGGAPLVRTENVRTGKCQNKNQENVRTEFVLTVEVEKQENVRTENVRTDFVLTVGVEKQENVRTENVRMDFVLTV